MSKEATGENGAVLGSSEYWSGINRVTFLGRMMQNPSDTNYHETLREIGNRASAAVDEIYNDLQDHINSIRAIPADYRNALAKQVQLLYDVCSMSGTFCSHSSECIGILSLSVFYLPGNSFRDEQAIQTAIHKITNHPDFFTSECLDIVNTVENKYMLGFAQTHQGPCPWTLPPFEKGGPKLYYLSTASTITAYERQVGLPLLLSRSTE